MRVTKHLIILVISILVLMQTSIVFADHQGMADYQRQKMSKFTTSVAELQEKLVQMGPDNWTDAVLSEYAVNACWLLYYGINCYMFERDEIPASLDELLVAEIITEIPGNPLRNWEPMQMLEMSDGFSALDLVIQPAPRDYYSLIGSSDSYTLVPLSFELCVYGPRIDHKPGIAATPNPNNKNWAQVPAGVLLMTGAFSETANTTLAKIEKRIEADAVIGETGKEQTN